jgi:hypothetical protein
MLLHQRLTCSIRDTEDATGFSRSKVNDLIKDGRLETVKVDRRRLIKVPSLLRLLELDPKVDPARRAHASA